MASDDPKDWPVVFSYTRAQAIEDGVLVDLTSWAKETGFVLPVACTHTVWQGSVVPPAGMEGSGQSERGRAHDLLWMLYLAIRSAPSGQQQLLFKVGFLQADRKVHEIQLKAMCGPGDSGEPVLTVMLPEED